MLAEQDTAQKNTATDGSDSCRLFDLLMGALDYTRKGSAQEIILLDALQIVARHLARDAEIAKENI